MSGVRPSLWLCGQACCWASEIQPCLQPSQPPAAKGSLRVAARPEWSSSSLPNICLRCCSCCCSRPLRLLTKLRAPPPSPLHHGKSTFRAPHPSIPLPLDGSPSSPLPRSIPARPSRVHRLLWCSRCREGVQGDINIVVGSQVLFYAPAMAPELQTLRG